MTSIWDILDETEFNLQLALKNIRVQTHPDFPELSIANYTEQAAFNRDWNNVTRTCRGLIWNNVTGNLLARPFPKFHNWDEKEAPRILDNQVMWHWADKADGSLGIMYVAPDKSVRLATRGSFASDQAFLGTLLLNKWHLSPELSDAFGMMDSGYTPLYEIVGPENRIVLQYPENVLVPLGYIHMLSGEFVPPAGAEPRTMGDLLMDLSRSNAEGWVVWLSDRQAVKIKQADYIELHRMVSNLNEKEVWRQLRSGMYKTYVEQLPDELFALADEWRFQLEDQFINIHTQAHMDLVQTPVDGSRKDSALWINANVPARTRGLVFGLLDGKDITDAIWRLLEPSGGVQ